MPVPYRRYVGVAARLTNPLATRSLLEIGATKDGPAAFFPASRSLEGGLFKRLYGLSPIPEGHELMGDFIDAIRRKSISLEPRTDSGWYDHQTYALETLVRPVAAAEFSKFTWDDEYGEFCAGVFQAMLTKRRETHVKQIEITVVGAGIPRDAERTFRIRPRVRAEPQITVFRRRADAYRFIRQELVRLLGEGALAATPLQSPDGKPGRPLLASLVAMEERFRGVAALLSSDFGVSPEAAGAGLTETEALAAGEKYLRALGADASRAELENDPRVMVPVAFDVGRQEVRCWAVLGVAARPVSISYSTLPEVSAESSSGQHLDDSEYAIKWESAYVELPYKVWIECSVKEPLNREEFRALCDRHHTNAAIRKALGER